MPYNNYIIGALEHCIYVTLLLHPYKPLNGNMLKTGTFNGSSVKWRAVGLPPRWSQWPEKWSLAAPRASKGRP